MKPIKILKSMKPYCLNPEIKDRNLRLVDGIARLMMIILIYSSFSLCAALAAAPR